MLKAKTKFGVLVGSEVDGVSTFFGVPYAKPPVGELRWRAPQPCDPWQGEREAKAFPCKAWQAPQEPAPDAAKSQVPGQVNYGLEFFNDPAFMPPMSEDCLYLNIWTPAKAPDEKLPVAFWIHGGAFMGGFGSEMEMDGMGFAKRGVILVTINYRLGELGFLCHPQLAAENEDGHCGNYGILDQLAALRWVRENIGAFGGDPDKVTIFGQSAGAMSVQTLVSSPLGEGLFRGAILQSGGGYKGGFCTDMTMDTAMALGEALMKTLGKSTIEELRALSPAEILAARGAFFGQAMQIHQGLPFVPVLDGWLLPEGYQQALENGHYSRVNYMLGSCGDDMMKEMAAAGALNWSLLGEAQGRPGAYVYRFNRKLPGDMAGAFHSSELWYVFHTLDRCWRPMTEGDYRLADEMADAWANFVKTGTPDPEGRLGWKPCTQAEPFIKVFDVE